MKSKIVPINKFQEPVIYLDRLPELKIEKFIEKLYKK